MQCLNVYSKVKFSDRPGSKIQCTGCEPFAPTVENISATIYIQFSLYYIEGNEDKNIFTENRPKGDSTSISGD